MTDKKKAPSASVPTGPGTATTHSHNLPLAAPVLLARLPLKWRGGVAYQAALKAYARIVIAPRDNEARNPDVLHARRLTLAWRAACAAMACKRRHLTIRAVANDLAGIAERGPPPSFDLTREAADYLVLCAAAGDKPPFELTT